MLRLRPYKDSDAKYLIDWMEDEASFVKWCANHFHYPLTIDELYQYRNFHDESTDSLLFTAIDEDGIPMGHILFSKLNFKENSVHLGHVIVDSKNRGNGLGQEMLMQALQYAFHILSVSTVTLAVFDNNTLAYNCYKKLGFQEYETYQEVFPFYNEKWGCYYMQIVRDNFTFPFNTIPSGV